MADLFKVKIVHSQSHLVFPKIVACILVILLVVIIIQEYLKAKNAGKKLFNFKDKKFFVENYDKLKFFGSIILFVLYILFLEILGFLVASIIFITLFNILFAPVRDKKSIINSVIISVVASVVLWYSFGYVFNITLP